ncbi:MAG: FkbM family methyltransferase [Methylococcaceae bacterium]|nr:FkbM family methyltransferase [Methylococcaceae bacterium]
MLGPLKRKLRGFRQYLVFDNPFQLIFNRLLFSSDIEVYYFNGLRILVDREGGDVNGVRDCLATNMYRKFIENLNILHHSAVILDIGANVGGFSLLLVSEGIVPSKIIAVEMNPNTFFRLANNLTANLDVSILSLINKAVTARRGVIEVRLGRGGTSDSLLVRESASKLDRFVKNRIIETTTIDDLIAESIGDQAIDVCKIDIEGAEWEALLDGKCDRLVQCKSVVMEIHPQEGRETQQLVDRLFQLGFGLQQVDDAVYLFEKVGNGVSFDSIVSS